MEIIFLTIIMIGCLFLIGIPQQIKAQKQAKKRQETYRNNLEKFTKKC